MCLIKNKKYHPFNRPLITEEDIVCYKQLYVNYKNEIVTPYTKILVPIKCIQKNTKKRIPFKAEIVNKFKFIWRHVFGFSNVVTDGFIHTFSSAPPYYNLGWGDRVFKCVIPKGTKYFIGECEDEYASEQIIFGERLK
jgi:hypothetical protein